MPEKLPQETHGEAEIENESPKMELMKRSHDQASVAFRLEQMLSNKTTIDLSDREIEKNLEELPNETRIAFSRILERYGEQIKDSGLSMRALVDFLEENKKFGANIENTPEWFGSMMFRQRTYRDPVGKVTFEQREGYFVMTCEDPLDYALAVAGAGGNPNSKASTLSGGSYHGVIYLKFPGRMHFTDDHIATPVLMIRGYADPSVVQQVVLHERQHFINGNLFRNFTDVEKVQDHDLHWREQMRAHGVKDELLAYIRDGSRGNRIKEALFGELYEHLFADMSEEEKKMATDVINQVGEFLDKNLWFLDNKQSRAILVYQLAGIPLGKFPHWLRAFEEYYRERMKLMKSFSDIYTLDPDGGVNALTEDIFPSDTGANGARGAIEKIWNQMDGIEEGARAIVFDLANDPQDTKQQLTEPLAKYSALYKELQIGASQLMRNSVVMPHSGPSDLYEYGRASEDSALGETKFTERMKAVVVDAVSNFSQAEVDAISDYLNEKDKPKPKSLRTLERVIKDAIHYENNSQPCTMYFRSDPTYELSFEVIIDFRVNEEDKAEGIKGAWFPLHIHSSKFKLFKAER